ncbi:MAG: alpha/beta hydrolase, partial [Alphaproteobacteria bacterium]|nr:alpha/beta hydrolase [Alphaproteobacteria bacterium]
DSSKSHDSADYEPQALVDDLIGLLDHLDVARVDVLGYSMGGRLALALASACPQRVDHVVAAGVGGRLLAPPSAPGAMAAAMEAANPADISEPMLRSFRHFADEQGADCKALAAFSRGPATPLSAERLALISAPCLIIAGARDPLAGDPTELAALIPGAKARQLPGCDHFSAVAHGLLKASVFDFFADELDL